MNKLVLTAVSVATVLGSSMRLHAQIQPLQQGPPVVQQPRTQLPHNVPLDAWDQMRREIAELNAKVALLQKQVQALQPIPQQISQIQQHLNQIDVSLKITYDNGRLTSDTLKTYCHSLADNMDKSYIIDVSQRRLAANCKDSLVRVK